MMDKENSKEIEIDEVQQEVQKVQKIKMLTTVLAILIVVSLSIIFWDPTNSYSIQLQADKNDGYVWSYTIDKEGILEETTNYYVSGVYTFEFEGVSKGKVKLHFTCIQNGNKDNPIEERTYVVVVNSDLKPIQNAIHMY